MILCLEYLYRDSGNFKLFQKVYFFKRERDLGLNALLAEIEHYLIDGTDFIPELWGLPRLHFPVFDPELDHEWHEFFSLSEVEKAEGELRDWDMFMENVRESGEKKLNEI